MPKRKSPGTLRDVSLQRVARSLDKYWFTDFDSHFCDLPRLLYVIGPFEHFTGDLVQSLIGVLSEEKCLKRKHFHFLLQSAVSVLDLSNCGSVPNHDSVIKLMTARCTRLTQVNLKSLNQVSARVLADLVSKVPNLKSLCLSGTKCNDQVLSLIGHHSIELRELDISSTQVTDSGAFSMCPGFPVEPLKPGCPNLIKLDITGTRITSHGAGMLLERLNNLQYLHYADVCGLIEECIAKQKLFSSTDCTAAKLPLKSLTTSGLKVNTVTDKSIQLSCEICPSVTEVHLFCGITDSNIVHLAQLKNLRMLELANVHANQVTFSGGLLYVLTEIGANLLTLSLNEINNIDMSALGVVCPRLRKLSIVITIHHYDHATFLNSALTEDSRKNIFKDLQILKLLLPVENENFPVLTLQSMLSNAVNLKDVHFLKVNCVNSDVLQRVLAVNNLSHMIKLRVDMCNNIDEVGILLLLSGDNSLTELELIRCDNISLQDAEKFRKYAQDMMYHVKITWE